jgi:hypothetical protein
MRSARASSGTNLLPTLPRWVVVIPILISTAIFFFHLSVIHRNAINLPFWDDWAAFDGDHHPPSVDAASVVPPNTGIRSVFRTDAESV